MVYHVPVLVLESIEALQLTPGGVYADLTLGGGGHARAILEGLGPQGRLLCFDQDEAALRNVPPDPRALPIWGNFRHLRQWLDYYGVEALDGVIADLGVSSHHFDTAERGFSFRYDGPMDMRMRQSASRSAEDVLAQYDQQALADIFRHYGELDCAWKLAGAIVDARQSQPIRSTAQLRALVQELFPHVPTRNKLLAKVFQALRIEVNGELEALRALLPQLVDAIRPGGRVVFIAYHSLEDRLVKEFLRDGIPGAEASPDLLGQNKAPFRPVKRKPVVPSEEELLVNSRARSAKLRVGERV